MAEKKRSVAPIAPTVVTGTGRYYLLSFSTQDAVLEKTVLKEMKAENWSSVLVCWRGYEEGISYFNCATSMAARLFE